MAKYIDIKVVEAVPMTAGAAVKKGYTAFKALEDKNYKGYETTYSGGHKIWRPYDMFEKNNVCVQGLYDKFVVPDGKKVEPFIETIIEEYNRMNVKYGELMEFINDEYKLSKLDIKDQNDLIYQSNAMAAYISVLRKRFKRLINKYPFTDVE